ncbi:MAG: hypothetical protein D6786_04875 [Gammaproteobacteria bacterium]|nr:MAG: hypothetical protein D6786_04875 [Gammaproteobacteria bacterium]
MTPISLRDGRLTLFLGTAPDGRGWIATADGGRRWTFHPLPPETLPAGAVSRITLGGDGRSDLLILRRDLLDLVIAPEREQPEIDRIGLPGLRAVATGDLDGDGQTDLYLAFEEGRDRTWFHQGRVDLRGVPDFSETMVEEELPGVLGVELLDLDADGDLDLVRGQQGGVAILYNNGLGRFSRLNLDAALIGGCRRALSLDADGDGLVDLLLHGGCPGALLMNRGRLRFERRGLPLPGLAEGESRLLQWGDPDNDGHPDLLLLRQGELLLIPLRGGRAGPPRTLRQGVSHARLLDLDGDGWEDLLARNLEGRPLVRYQEPGRAHWLGVRLAARRAAAPEGATLLVVRRDGGRNAVQLTSASLLGDRLRVGLGRLSQVDLAVIDWPSGMRSSLAPPLLDHYSRISEPEPRHRPPVYRRPGQTVRSRLTGGVCR